MDIVEFLRARLDEDERHAEALLDVDLRIGDELLLEPGRLLKEAGAKRRIVDDYVGLWESAKHMARARADEGLITTSRNMYAGMMMALKALATVHADHPDYQQEWKP